MAAVDSDDAARHVTAGARCEQQQRAGDLGGVYYTTYEDALEFFGIGGEPPKLADVIESLNDINVDLDLMDAPINFDVMVDPTLTDGLFDGHKR